ncbi:unnamed protein product [Amoebophrya sp. A120]|nr:unnamed protein product [Amoebophrya sp. A120]|eukprot:GSA120T00017550001.1
MASIVKHHGDWWDEVVLPTHNREPDQEEKQGEDAGAPGAFAICESKQDESNSVSERRQVCEGPGGGLITPDPDASMNQAKESSAAQRGGRTSQFRELSFLRLSAACRKRAKVDTAGEDNAVRSSSSTNACIFSLRTLIEKHYYRPLRASSLEFLRTLQKCIRWVQEVELGSQGLSADLARCSKEGYADMRHEAFRWLLQEEVAASIQLWTRHAEQYYGRGASLDASCKLSCKNKNYKLCDETTESLTPVLKQHAADLWQLQELVLEGYGLSCQSQDISAASRTLRTWTPDVFAFYRGTTRSIWLAGRMRELWLRCTEGTARLRMHLGRDQVVSLPVYTLQGRGAHPEIEKPQPSVEIAGEKLLAGLRSRNWREAVVQLDRARSWMDACDYNPNATSTTVSNDDKDTAFENNARRVSTGSSFSNGRNGRAKSERTQYETSELPHKATLDEEGALQQGGRLGSKMLPPGATELSEQPQEDSLFSISGIRARKANSQLLMPELKQVLAARQQVDVAAECEQQHRDKDYIGKRGMRHEEDDNRSASAKEVPLIEVNTSTTHRPVGQPIWMGDLRAVLAKRNVDQNELDGDFDEEDAKNEGLEYDLADGTAQGSSPTTEDSVGKSATLRTSRVVAT